MVYIMFGVRTISKSCISFSADGGPTSSAQVLVFSCFAIRIHQPPSVRLVDTTLHLSTPRTSVDTRAYDGASTRPFLSSVPVTASGPSEPDHFAALSLSSDPIISSSTVNPIFGRPSLHAPSSPPKPLSDAGDDASDDPDAMDWEPSAVTPSGSSELTKSRGRAVRDDDNGSWLRPQRFFAPEQPTGLEGLLMRTRLMDDDLPPFLPDSQGSKAQKEFQWNWCWVYALSLIPLAVLAVLVWDRRAQGRGYS